VGPGNEKKQLRWIKRLYPLTYPRKKGRRARQQIVGTETDKESEGGKTGKGKGPRTSKGKPAKTRMRRN